MALGTILVLLLGLGGAVAPLQARLESWPNWRLPAPLLQQLQRPGNQDLHYPAWFVGQWQVSSRDGEAEWHYPVRFHADDRGQVVGDRAFNAAAVGRAMLGDQLLEVANDPANPNRQLARLAGEQQLESTVIGRRTALAADGSFLADELALQVLHGPTAPRVSRVETLSRYRLLNPDRIEAEQWQGSYSSPADGLAAAVKGRWHADLSLTRTPSASEAPNGVRNAPPGPRSDPAS